MGFGHGFIVIPLIIMVIFCMLSVLGLGSAFATSGNSFAWAGLGSRAPEDGWYDSTGRMILNATGDKVVDEWIILNSDSLTGEIGGFSNSSGYYPLSDPVQHESAAAINIGLAGGMTVIILPLMGLGMLAGVKILGVGLSDNTVGLVVKGTVYLSIWALLTIGAVTMIFQIPFFGYIIYFCLSLIFTLGIINSVGHPMGGD